MSERSRPQAAGPWLDRRRRGILLALGAAVALFIADLANYTMNPAILYTIVMYVVAIEVRGRWTVLLAGALMIASFAGLLLGPYPPETPTAASLVASHRFTNRSFCALAILVTAMVAGWQRRLSFQMQERVAIDDMFMENSMYQELMSQIRFLATLLIACAITGALVAVDWTTPADVNFPILYAVPLLLCVLSGSVRTVWIMTPALIAFTWAGFWNSPARIPDLVVPSPVNRIVATLMIMMLAAIGTWVTRRVRA